MNLTQATAIVARIRACFWCWRMNQANALRTKADVMYRVAYDRWRNAVMKISLP
jgi:hypothetical protein